MICSWTSNIFEFFFDTGPEFERKKNTFSESAENVAMNEENEMNWTK
jgi:hypothetical protein